MLKATQALTQKLDSFLIGLAKVKPTAQLEDQWRAVKQQTDATEALVSTGADYEEVLIQYKRLGAALSEARRLMYLEGVCYSPEVADLYQAVRLSYRRLDRNMSGLPTYE